MEKRVLIIGSLGFIGKHLTAYLGASGYLVFGCDVIQDYNQSNYTVIDATNADFNTLFENQTYDYCVNCSGAANVSDSLKNPLRDYHLNTYNVFCILESIRKFNSACKFINLSSAAVYGNPECLPVVESQSLQPTSPYGFHKLQAEQICREFHNFYGIRTCSLRIFSAYGPGLKKQLFWDVYNKMLAQDVISLWGTGAESRDFIYIEDLVRCIANLLSRPQFFVGELNVGTGIELQIRTVVEIFAKIMGFDVSGIKFTGEIRKGDPQNWRADIQRIKSIIPGYLHITTIEQGLTNYYLWLQQIEKK